MQPETAAALNVPPYNTFTLRCIATVPDNVLVQKSFEWRDEDNVVNDNGNTILISRRNTSVPQSVSELTVNDPSVGSHSYSCIVRMVIPRGLNIDGNGSGIVTVRGRCFL